MLQILLPFMEIATPCTRLISHYNLRSARALGTTLLDTICVFAREYCLGGHSCRCNPLCTRSDNTLPVAIITADEEILTHVSISKDACIPLVGKVTFIIRAANGNTPARFFGVRTDAQVLATDFASVWHDVTSTDAPYGVRITASEKLYGVTILAPFISANSLILPGATISVTRSGTC